MKLGVQPLCYYLIYKKKTHLDASFSITNPIIHKINFYYKSKHKCWRRGFKYIKTFIYLFTYIIIEMYKGIWGFLGSSAGKKSTCNTGHPGLIPASGRSPGERNWYLLQCSCLENPMDRGTWQATVHGVTKSQTWLSN